MCLGEPKHFLLSPVLKLKELPSFLGKQVVVLVHQILDTYMTACIFSISCTLFHNGCGRT